MLQYLIDAQNKLVEVKQHLLDYLKEDQDPNVTRIIIAIDDIIGNEEYADSWGIVSMETIINRLENATRD